MAETNSPMRSFCLFFSLLICLTAFGQGKTKLEVPKMLAVRSAAGGGGGGSPGVASIMNTNTASGTTSTLHNFPVSGVNTLLLVSSTLDSGTVTGVSFNGSSSGWTKLTSTNWFDTVTPELSVWYKIGPASATADIVVTHDNVDGAFTAILVTNANQSTPFGTVIKVNTGVVVNGTTNSFSASSGDLIFNAVASQASDLIPLAPTVQNWTNIARAPDYNLGGTTNASGATTKTIWYRPASPSDTAVTSLIGVNIKP